MTKKIYVALVLGLACVPPALAYVGPGAGFAVITSFFAVFASMALALFAFLTLPIRRIIRAFKRRRAMAGARVNRVVILGLDGFSPVICEELMRAGKLPHLAKLAAEGSFRPLATTVPSVSPVAWSTFQTGSSPARHNIFDFLTRDRATYLPDLSSARIGPPRRFIKLGRYRIPIGKATIKLLRKGQPFWKILGDHGVFSNILRVPITFPPEKFHGLSLSAMCVPDLLGTQGTFSYYYEDAGKAISEGGQAIAVKRDGDVVRAEVQGPGNPIVVGNPRLSLPFRVGTAKGGAALTLGRTRYKLKIGEYSDWTPVVFDAGLGVKVRGAARFLLKSLQPFEMYVTPINIDADKPALPISHPYVYAVYLAKLIGRYSTLGLAEDTWGLNEGVLTEDEFLNQVWTHHREREDMFFDALAKTRQGVVACVFDTSDRVQHMFWRYRVSNHPANAGRDVERNAGVIDDMYERLDGLVGETVNHLQAGDVLIVMSDHGFTSFERGFNVNAWLRQEGYLFLKDGEQGGKWLSGVDWSRTRAYALGLGGIYLNVKGRESRGIVERAAVADLKAEIKQKLTGVVDDGRGQVAVKTVYDLAEIYSGPYLDGGPELVAGYNAGWRASWAAATGGTGGPLFEDNAKPWSGDHCVAAEVVPGVFFSNAKLGNAHPHIADVAPTVLDLFGVSKPAFMEGAALDLDLAGAHPENGSNEKA